MKPITYLVAALLLNTWSPGARHIRPNQQRYLIYKETAGKATVISTLQRTIKDTSLNGKPVWLCMQRYDRPNGKTDIDSSFLDKRTMFPVAYRAAVDLQREMFLFHNGRMQGVVSIRDSILKRIDEPFDAGIYCSVAELELIESLPLKYGFEYKSRTVNPGYPVSDLHIRVSGEETLSYGGSSVPCWKVMTRYGQATTGATLWISKSGQQLVKHHFQLNENTSWWKVRLPD